MRNFAIAIHGGAEDKSREEIGSEKESGFRKGLAVALEAGWQILIKGGTAVEGRIGDSPLIGCGTYANNEVCAVSCTGDGESIIRAVIAHEVYALMKYNGLPIAEAARQAREVYHDKIQKDRNLIAIDSNGEIALEYETQLMFRGYRKGNGEPFIAIWED